MGDGVLAYFGYPEAHEDDAERAVRTGLELISAVSALKTLAPLQARAGIATGTVIVGDILEADEARERGVIGETPNLAERLQGVAEPGMVVIAESTRKQLGKLFDLEDLGEKTLKGIPKPVRSWAVLRKSAADNRFEALHPGATALVGREAEIELLKRCWRSAKDGQTSVVLVSAEAGLGKERARLWYEPHLDRIHEDAVVRRADLIQLEQIASGYPSRERFLTELTLDPPDATSDQAGVPLLDEDYLILSTIHSAKGQEWKSVFVLNVVDGCLPSDLGAGTSAEIDEERRLLYVAMTRAKDDLHLIVPQRFFTHGQSAQGDRHVYASRTRFIPDGLLGLFDRTSWPAVAVGATAHAASQGVSINVGARMRGMWR